MFMCTISRLRPFCPFQPREDAIASDDELELDSPFMDAGMDSLSSVALMSMVAKDSLRCVYIHTYTVYTVYCDE